MHVHPSMQYIRHVLSICHSKAQPAFGILETPKDFMQVKHPMHKTSVSFLPVYPTKLPLRTLSQNALHGGKLPAGSGWKSKNSSQSQASHFINWPIVRNIAMALWSFQCAQCDHVLPALMASSTECTSGTTFLPSTLITSWTR